MLASASSVIIAAEGGGCSDSRRMAGCGFFVRWSFAFNLSLLRRKLYVSSKVVRCRREIKTMRGGAVSVGTLGTLLAVLLATCTEKKKSLGYGWAKFLKTYWEVKS